MKPLWQQAIIVWIKAPRETGTSFLWCLHFKDKAPSALRKICKTEKTLSWLTNKKRASRETSIDWAGPGSGPRIWYWWNTALLCAPLSKARTQGYVNLTVTNTLAIWCEELTHWKRSWYWERLKARGTGDDREGGGWMASPTRWTWVWASSRSWWWTGRPGMRQSVGSQRARHNWAAELNWRQWPE